MTSPARPAAAGRGPRGDGGHAAAAQTSKRSTGKSRALTGTKTSGRSANRRFFIAAQDHNAPFVWVDRLPFPNKLAIPAWLVSRRRSKQPLVRGASPCARRKGRPPGKGRRRGFAGQSLDCLLSEARAASVLAKDGNVNLFRRRSSDFFDDYDHPAVCAPGADDVFSDAESGGGCDVDDAAAAAEEPAPPVAAVEATSACSSSSKSNTGSRSGGGSTKDGPEVIAVLSDGDTDSDDEGGKWAVPTPVKTIGSVEIHAADLNSLRPRSWLTDAAINAFLHLLNQLEPPAARHRVHACSTFFYPKLKASGHYGVRRWCKGIDLAGKDMLLFPINFDRSHWSLVVARVPERVLLYYDSLDISGKAQVSVVRRFLKERFADGRKWTRAPKPLCWKQHNLYDCGVHLCRTAFLLTTGHDAVINVKSTGDTTRFRKKILKCLMTGAFR